MRFEVSGDASFNEKEATLMKVPSGAADIFLKISLEIVARWVAEYTSEESKKMSIALVIFVLSR